MGVGLRQVDHHIISCHPAVLVQPLLSARAALVRDLEDCSAALYQFTDLVLSSITFWSAVNLQPRLALAGPSAAVQL